MTLSAGQLSALTTKAATYAGINEESSDQLDLVVQSVFDRMEGECHRHFYSASYSEIHSGSSVVVLNEPNVTSVGMVSDDLDAVLDATYTGSDPTARIEVTDTGIVLTSVAGTTTTNTITFANETTIGAMATAISAVSGWSSQTLVSETTIGTASLARTGARDAKNKRVQIDHWADYGCEYVTDYGEGVLTLYSQPMGRVRVDYTAGWDDASLPEELEMVLFRTVKSVIDLAAKDGGVKSEKLGEYAYVLAAVESVAWDASSRRVLSRYERRLP